MPTLIPDEFAQLLKGGALDRFELLFAPSVLTRTTITPASLQRVYQFKVTFRGVGGRQPAVMAFLQAVEGMRTAPTPQVYEVRYGCVFYQQDVRVLELYASRSEDQGILIFRSSKPQSVVLTPRLRKWLHIYEECLAK